jgi:short subunit dehydrogenase-like uncharacterized protein
MGKDFDIIVYGASGFTGRLVAEYLASHQEAGEPIRWAMAGRSLEKLAEVRAEMGVPSDVPLVQVDSNDADTVKNLVQSTKCVLTTVGPYQLYGSTIVEACAEHGTDYVDLCGEPGWMHEMIGKYEATAKASGARIVFSCGFDSIPFDLGVYALQNEAKERFGSSASRVKCRVRAMNGEFSGGTAASLNATMAALGTNPALVEVLVNPFSLANGFQGPEQPAGDQPIYDQDRDTWLAPFIMAAINTKNIHRSNALLGHAYGQDFVYDEMMVAGSGAEGEAAAKFIAGHNPLTGDGVPQPGEGPDKASREAGNYDVLFIGELADGQVLDYSVSGDMDPGYGSTSKMIAQSAICLVRDCTDLQGGIYTPAPAMGAKLIGRLQAHAGLTFKSETAA